MKRFETNKIGLIFPIVLSVIFIAVAICTPFFPGEQKDMTARYIIMSALMVFGLIIGIGGIVSYLKETRENRILNDFIKQCGSNAIATFAIYIKTDDQLIFESTERALKTCIPELGLAKMVKTDTTIHYAIICDDGIYFIPFKSIGTPEKNTFYKRGCLPQHSVIVNEKGMIILTCPDIKMLFVLGVTKKSDVSNNELLSRLNNLYGNTLQKDSI